MICWLSLNEFHSSQGILENFMNADQYPISEIILISICIVGMMLYGYFSKKTDWTGSLSGGVIAFVIYFGTGLPGLIYFLLFFLLGSLASKWKYSKKFEMGFAQENQGRRTAVHAFCNAGAAAFFAMLILFDIDEELLHLSVACVFSAALSDTFSSEIGNVVGSKYFNVLTLKPDRRGKDGVVSLEGSLAGIMGSFIIALAFLIFNLHWMYFLLIFFSGLMANLLDSILGASLQKKGILNNHLVNLVSTFAAGLIGLTIGIGIT